MSELRYKDARDPIHAIWKMLATGNVWYRAAAILLLKEYAAQLTANGYGEYAPRLVQQFREDDPFKYTRPKHSKDKLRP